MKAPFYQAAGPLPPWALASFDSASAMVRALASFLRGSDFPALGMAPPSSALAALINSLPKKARERLYVRSGWAEGIPEADLGRVDVEEISRWVTNLYPRQQYPAAMIGSSSGALVHLCAALGVPWLPQTFLIPVRQHRVHPDEMWYAMEAFRKPARALLEANPDIQLHHMHDPNQDRLMSERMAYFRVKQRRLGPSYEAFLEQTLEPGGTIVLVECRREWSSTRVQERHYFQAGAVGGATPDEFFHGSRRLERYLERYHSHRRKWEPPPPDTQAPEAEWGFEPALAGDVERFARERGYQVRRLVFQEPEHLSPFVADLYRTWNRRRGLPANRLLVESFVLLEPWWTLRLGAVPFWLKFNMEPSAQWLERYLDESEPFDEIRMFLFSHGVDCVGLVPLYRWRLLLQKARREGSFVGVDTTRYPRDFGSMIRYYTDLRQLPARYALPPPLDLGELDAFIAARLDDFVTWEGGTPAGSLMSPPRLIAAAMPPA